MNNDETNHQLDEAKRSDDQLLQMLDESSGLWLVRGGLTGVLISTTTLRAALHRAYEFSKEGQSPGPIVRMPDDNVSVPAEQIYRLWLRLNFAVR